MTNRSIAVTGSSGQVGFAVKSRLDCCQVIEDRFTSNMAPVIEKLEQHHPSRLINAAAYTAVDRAETEQILANTVNAHATGVLADWCAKNACFLVHFSTDYVFDGSVSRPYVETDPARPINAYGSSKHKGESAIFQHQLAGVIYRTSWVMGVSGHNFVRTMLRLGTERDTLAVVSDQWGRPTSADLLAEAALFVSETHSPTMSLFHLTDSGEPTNWYEIACYALDRARDFGYRGLSSEAIQPISTAQYPTPARRPANSLLDCSRFDRVIGLARPHWKLTVDRIVEHVLPA